MIKPELTLQHKLDVIEILKEFHKSEDYNEDVLWLIDTLLNNKPLNIMRCKCYDGFNITISQLLKICKYLESEGFNLYD